MNHPRKTARSTDIAHAVPPMGSLIHTQRDLAQWFGMGNRTLDGGGQSNAMKSIELVTFKLTN